MHSKRRKRKTSAKNHLKKKAHRFSKVDVFVRIKIHHKFLLGLFSRYLLFPFVSISLKTFFSVVRLPVCGSFRLFFSLLFCSSFFFAFVVWFICFDHLSLVSSFSHTITVFIRLFHIALYRSCCSQMTSKKKNE